MSETILIFGNGYVAKRLAEVLKDLNWQVYVTTREESFSQNDSKIKRISFFDLKKAIIEQASYVLSTVPPDEKGSDPVLEQYYDLFKIDSLKWIGYLSATNVYGDHQGSWVDEGSECRPGSLKAKYRLQAEKEWLGLYTNHNLPVHIFRLAGIYGPERNSLQSIKAGKRSTVFKAGHFFSRVHVTDICNIVLASINDPCFGEVYNVSDNKPALISEVQKFAANLLGENLVEVPFEQAEISEKMKGFFHDNKKVSNKKVLNELKVKLTYPDYKSGLSYGCGVDFKG